MRTGIPLDHGIGLVFLDDRQVDARRFRVWGNLSLSGEVDLKRETRSRILQQ